MSTIKVNKIEKRSGSTLELGGACTAVTLASGATQTGFGRTGTVDWCTTAKTSPFTATNGDGFFVNTIGGAITVTLPSSPTAGSIVAFKDYNNSWDDACRAVTLCRNGSKIGGSCNNATLTAEAQSVTLIYVDGTKGWMDIHDSAANVAGALYTTATGGTITTSGDFKIHTFTGDGNFVVSQVGNCAGGGSKASYMVIGAGGGGGGSRGCYNGAGGGGAGGFREGKVASGPGSDPYTASPLVAPDGHPLAAQTYPIQVGGGGAAGQGYPQPALGTNGEPSIFSSIIGAGGGGGGAGWGSTPSPTTDGGDGGSGGGKKHGGVAGSGNTPPVNPSQGNDGGATSPPTNASSGGGGAGAVGGTGGPGCSTVGAGGAGVTTSINASPVVRASGGSGATYNGCGAPATPGGGGAGGPVGGPSGDRSGGAGTANTGGGGGGSGASSTPGDRCGGAGGSGIVIIRYKFQN